MRLPNKTFILVADGARMRILRNQGDANDPDVLLVEHREIHTPPNRALRSDAPGLAFASGHPARSTFDEGNPHLKNKRDFLSAAVDALARAVAGEQGGILIIAPPAALGELRHHYTPDVKSRLIGELDKDLTRHSVEQLARLLGRI
ncbi:host attachment family protein [Sphingopyxis chilensis]